MPERPCTFLSPRERMCSAAPPRTGATVLLPDSRILVFLVRQPLHVLVIGLMVSMCYLLARYSDGPVRNLQSAVDRFGRGDLTARAEESRHDELGDLAVSFNRMANRIQTLLAAERRLLFDISHELRSPLARLSVAVELARDKESSGLPLDRIQKEADRLNALIRQMLEVTARRGRTVPRLKLCASTNWASIGR